MTAPPRTRDHLQRRRPAAAPRAPTSCPRGAFTIAADSGVEHALALEWPIDLAVGDFDSVSAGRAGRGRGAGARVERHPVAKDHTDLELALDAALARRPDEIVVVGGHGGRVDHFLAAALVLTRDAYAGIAVRAIVGAGPAARRARPPRPHRPPGRPAHACCPSPDRPPA